MEKRTDSFLFSPAMCLRETTCYSMRRKLIEIEWFQENLKNNVQMKRHVFPFLSVKKKYTSKCPHKMALEIVMAIIVFVSGVILVQDKHVCH